MHGRKPTVDIVYRLGTWSKETPNQLASLNVFLRDCKSSIICQSYLIYMSLADSVDDIIDQKKNQGRLLAVCQLQV